MKGRHEMFRYTVLAACLVAGCGDEVGSDPPRLTNDVEWVVQIGFSDHHHCTAMVLSEHWLLTAGHCVHDAIDDQVLVSRELFGERTVLYEGTASLILHPDYQARNLPSHRWHDIALVRLADGEAQAGERARLSGLTRTFAILLDRDRNLYSVGYGRLPDPKTGLCGETAGPKKRYDGFFFRDYTGPPIANALGVELEGRRDAVCHGDSGGPFLFDMVGAPHAFAVISGELRNDAISRGTLIGPKIEWIRSATAESEAPLDCPELVDGSFQCFEMTR